MAALLAPPPAGGPSDSSPHQLSWPIAATVPWYLQAPEPAGPQAHAGGEGQPGAGGSDSGADAGPCIRFPPQSPSLRQHKWLGKIKYYSANLCEDLSVIPPRCVACR